MKQDKTTIAPKFCKLEDLNLIDNFLFQQMLSQEGDGEEFARILLSTILGRQIRKVTIVPQKNIHYPSARATITVLLTHSSYLPVPAMKLCQML